PVPVAVNHASPAATTTASSHTSSGPQAAHAPADAPVSAQAAPRETEEAKLAPAPIVVKSGTTAKAKQAPSFQGEDAAIQAPSVLGVASPNEASLNGLLSTAAAKPSLSRVRVSQGVAQGMLIKRVQPKYPVNALATHTQGA